MTLFKIKNIRIKADLWFIVLGILWLFAGNLNVFISLSITVLLHELAHAVAARALGLDVVEITMYPFGGASEIAGIENNHLFEGIVALAGPFFSLLTGFLCYKICLAVNIRFLPEIATYSFSIAMFNFLPVYPLDGGRVLLSVLCGVSGPQKGKKRCGIVSMILSGILLLYSVLQLVFNRSGNTVLMALFLFTAALKEIKNPHRQVLREKLWQNCENVRMIKAYCDEELLQTQKRFFSENYFCVLVTDRKENPIAVLSEKQINDGILMDSSITFQQLLDFNEDCAKKQ